MTVISCISGSYGTVVVKLNIWQCKLIELALNTWNHNTRCTIGSEIPVFLQEQLFCGIINKNAFDIFIKSPKQNLKTL